MGTTEERHQGPGSRAVSAAARLRAQEGDGVLLDAYQPQSQPGAREPPPPPPRTPGAWSLVASPGTRGPGCGPRAVGGTRGGPEPSRAPAERAFSPPPVPHPPDPPQALGDHLRPSPPPPLIQVHPGLPPPGRPRTRSWREPIKAGDGATRGHTVQAPEQPPLERRQLLPCLDLRHDHGPSLGIRQAQRWVQAEGGAAAASGAPISAAAPQRPHLLFTAASRSNRGKCAPESAPPAAPQRWDALVALAPEVTVEESPSPAVERRARGRRSAASASGLEDSCPRVRSRGLS